MGVPLLRRGVAIGAVTFAMAESGRRYTPRDLEFATALADRAALAIENARLFREVEAARALTVQQLDAETSRRQQAEENTRFAEMFVGILGHDLRNPLGAVAMSASVLRRHGDVPKRPMNRILSSTQRMTNMVDQLLDLTRSRLADGIPIDPAPADLGAVVSSVVDEVRSGYPEREIRWASRSVPGRWDHDRLAQVVSNLVGNALEHGDPATPVTVELEDREDRAVLRIHNAGATIPEALLPMLFEPYRKASLRGPRSKGLGLGLFITNEIVVAHGGSIEVRSTDDAGTVFQVTLPR